MVERLKAGNARWWDFDVDTYTLFVKRYADGGEHPGHMGWTPDGLSQGRKISASIPLSDPADFADGRFVIRRIIGRDYPEIPIPGDKGGVAMFPPWLAHEVTPVTSGESWVLLLNAWGPRLQ